MTLSLAQAFPLFPPSDVTNAQVRSLIAENNELSNKPCAEIGKLKVYALAIKLQEIFPDELDSQATPVAREILQNIRDLELVEDEVPVASAPAQPPTQPIEVKVQLPKSIGEMGLSELLTHLSDNPQQYEEIAPYIEANPVIKKVLPKTLSYAILVAGKLNVELTIAYITLLSKVHSKPQRQFQGYRPVTLEAALGLRSRPVVHPLTGEPVEGPDEAGFDYSAISEELHLALLWAKQTKHAFWPTGMDIFTFGSEVTSETLPRRWQGILEDYQQARTAGEPSTEGLTRYWTQQQEVNAVAGEIRDLLNNIGVVRTPSGVRSEADYKALLEQSSAGDRQFVQTNVEVKGRVYDSMNVTGTNARINGAICLGRANVAQPALKETSISRKEMVVLSRCLGLIVVLTTKKRAMSSLLVSLV
jgi:hypothetical protein